MSAEWYNKMRNSERNDKDVQKLGYSTILPKISL